MKRASVRDLRNRYSDLLAWLAAGQEIVITQRGKAIARLIPEPPSAKGVVDWSKSPALRRDRSSSAQLSAEQTRRLLEESSGKW